MVVQSKQTKLFKTKFIKMDQRLRTLLDYVFPESLTKRYVLGLSVIAALAISGQVGISLSISALQKTQKEIRVIDRQIPVFEELKKSALALQISPNSRETDRGLQTLNRDQYEVQEALEGAAFDQQIPLVLLDTLRGHLQRMNVLLAQMSAVRLATRDLPRRYQMARLTPLADELLEVYTACQATLRGLTREMESNLDIQTRRFKQTEFWLFLGMLGVVLFEALYVFRPAVRRLYQALHTRSEFLSRMSHELRNPMNSIIGMADLLSTTPLNDQQAQYVSVMRRSGTGLLEMLNRLLDFSSLETGTLKIERIEFNLSNVLQRCVDLVLPMATLNKTNVVLERGAGVPVRVWGDPIRIQQILSNLLGNAVKFTKSGQVKLQVAVDPEGKIRFAVKDSGIGIEKENLARIFDAFVQADSSIRRRFGGSGLGLTISRDLVARMGGELKVESEKNRGSCFSFSLALEHSQQSSKQEPAENSLPKVQVEIDTRALKILIADDSPENHALLAAYLKEQPYKLVFVENGLEAVEKFKKEYFDMVLMDLEMPELDGFSATQEIRKWENTQHLKQKPIVVISAFRPDEKPSVPGVTRRLTKPLSSEILFQVIKEVTLQCFAPKVSPLSVTDLNAIDEVQQKILSLGPKYLEDRKKDLQTIQDSLLEQRFDVIKTLGHRMRGNALSYGFPKLGEIGGRLEEAAHSQDVQRAGLVVAEMRTFLEEDSVSSRA